MKITEMLSQQLDMVAKLAQRASKELSAYGTVAGQAGQDIATAKNILDAVAKTAKELAK